jgi:predicted DNA-binding protein (UPF0251 family)
MDLIISTKEELRELIGNVVENKLSEKISPLIKEISKNRLSDSRRVSRKEAAYIEGISITTLDKLSREGKYTKIKVGSKTLFDIDNNGRVK